MPAVPAPAVPVRRWVAAAAVVLAACSGGGSPSAGDDPSTTDGGGATTTTAADTTTTGSTTSTTLPRDGTTLDLPTPPVLRTGGEDFGSIIDQMVFYIAWVYHHPDPALVSNVYVENSPAWETSRAGVQAYVDRGVKDRGEPTVVSDVRVLETIDANHVVVYAVFTVPPYNVVSVSTGEVVEHRPGRAATGWSYELVRDGADPNGHWLVVNRTDLGELPQ